LVNNIIKEQVNTLRDKYFKRSFQAGKDRF